MLKRNKTLKTLLILSAIIVLSAMLITASISHSSQKKQNLSANTIPEYSFDLEKLPQLSAKHCIVTEYNSGRILYEKNAFRKSAMASTTKIMTALIVLEKCDLQENTTVSQNAASIGGSEIELKKGEEISVEHLLYGLMLESGNDAAIALAEHTADTVENFCKLMNDKAKHLGARNTNFTSPHGLDDENHYTTAYDLALITKGALENETFKKIVSTKNYTAGKRRFVNTNALLGTVEGVDGGKTGFTNNAGRCIVLTAKRSEMRIIVVIFGCPDTLNRTIDGKRIIECMYRNYKIYDILPESFKLGTLSIKKNKTAPSDIITTESAQLPLTQKEYTDMHCIAEIEGKKYTIPLKQNSQNPIPNLYTNKNSKAKSICGKITIICCEKEIFETDIIHTSDILKKTYSDHLVEVLKKFTSILDIK